VPSSNLRSSIVGAVCRRSVAAATLAAGLTGLLLLVLAGCGVGQRPTLADATVVGGAPGTPTGSAAADAVLTRLEGDQAPQLTATYAVTNRYGGRTRPATVGIVGDRTSVTIGDVRFLSADGGRTCVVTTGACDDGILEAEISDTGVTSQFYATSPARQLRVSLSRASGPPTASSTTLAGQPAVCVDVPVGTGHERTCATEDGILAAWDTAAVHVALTKVLDTADDALFRTKG